jgi:hypothetical protein
MRRLKIYSTFFAMAAMLAGCMAELGDEWDGEFVADEESAVPDDEKGSIVDKTYVGDLGVGLGSPVATGSTGGLSNEYRPSCVSNSSAPDATYTWTAPSAGSFVFDTFGSGFDTVLEIRRYADNQSLGCNDDTSGLQSKVTVSLSAGQTVLVVIDGYGSGTGTYRLNIGGGGGGGGCIDLAPTADADVFSRPDQTGTNRGSAQTLLAMAWTYSGVPGVYRSFLRFDLGQIPAGALINSATLSLFGCSVCSPGHSSLSGSNEADLYLITSPWQESTVTWNNQPSLSTPRVYIPQSTSSLQDYHLNITNAVIEARNNPAGVFGFGVKLRNEGYYRALMFQSREYTADPAKRPKLRVCYTQ